jgi:uncharacterized repeat protein (TIGR03803 family)
MFPPAIVSPLRLLALAGGLVLALAASPASAASYKLIYSFKGGFGGPVPSDGASPQAALINIGGTLYGTTSGGGGTTSCNSFDDGCGTVFKITPPAPLKTTWIETVLYRFKGGSDGALSEARLLNVGGTLYGTTDSGGTGCGGIGCGTVFKLTPPTAPKTAWTEAVLHRFKSSSDGEGPEAGLIDVGGTLYGTTAAGGGSTGCFTNVPGCGTVFKLAPQGAETVLHAFDGFRSDGGQPTGSLLNVGGTLYGTTLADRGTVFKITIKGVETVLHYFSGGSDASAPWAGLVDLGGTLYGTTVQGGG